MKRRANEDERPAKRRAPGDRTHSADGTGDAGLEFTEIDIDEVSVMNNFAPAYGAFGIIRKALYRGLVVARKELAIGLHAGSIPKRFYREALTWACLRRSRYVIPLLGICRSPEGLLYMISPWMENGNLKLYLRSQEHVDRVKLVAGIASGLRYLHGKNVVHGDLRGANILISDEGHPRICDFGLSLALDRLGLLAPGSSQNDLGAVRWMAPELFSGKSTFSYMTTMSDIWSFSMLVIEVYTGREPFASENLTHYQVPAYIQFENHRPPRPVQSETSHALSDALWEIIIQCWRHAPEQRPKARIVAARLKLLPASQDGSSSSATTDTHPDLEQVYSSEEDFTLRLRTAPEPKVNLTGEVTRFGRRPHATGPASTVWRGEWRQTSPSSTKVVALKTLHNSTMIAHGKMLLNHTRVLVSLDHPNVSRFFGITFGDGAESAMHVSLVSPYYEKGNVIQYLRLNPNVSRVQLVTDVAAGLAYLHSQKPAIVHGNLKCTNILVGDNERAVICDFGLGVLNALYFSEEGDDSDADAPETSSFNTPVASGHNKAFEFLKDDGRRPTRSSDVWEFGCIALQLLYNEKPDSSHQRDDRIIAAADQGKLPAKLLAGNDVSEKYIASDPTLFSSGLMTDHRMRRLIYDCWNDQSEKRPTMQLLHDRLTNDFPDCSYWTVDNLLNTFLMLDPTHPRVDLEQDADHRPDHNSNPDSNLYTYPVSPPQSDLEDDSTSDTEHLHLLWPVLDQMRRFRADIISRGRQPSIEISVEFYACLVKCVEPLIVRLFEEAQTADKEMIGILEGLTCLQDDLLRDTSFRRYHEVLGGETGKHIVSLLSTFRKCDYAEEEKIALIEEFISAHAQRHNFPRTAQVWLGVAWDLCESEHRSDDASLSYERCIAFARRHFDSSGDAMTLASSLIQYGIFLWKVERVEDACAAECEAVSLLENVKGPHPSASERHAVALAYRGITYLELGRSHEALASCTLAVDMGRSLVGSKHASGESVLALALTAMARCQIWDGNYFDAETALAEAKDCGELSDHIYYYALDGFNDLDAQLKQILACKDEESRLHEAFQLKLTDSPP